MTLRKNFISACIFVLLLAPGHVAWAWRSPADTSRAEVERALGDINRHFWSGSPNNGWPYSYSDNSGSANWGIVLGVVDANYWWWVLSGDSKASARVSAEWNWLNQHFTQFNLQGCGQDKYGDYIHPINWAQDDATWDAKVFLQIYDITHDQSALQDAIMLQKCVVSRWSAENGGFYYDDSLKTKADYQIQWALNAYKIWSINADQTLLVKAEVEMNFVNSVMLRQDHLYWHAVKYDNTLIWPEGSPPHIPGSSVCLNGNLSATIFAAEEYARTQEDKWLKQIVMTVDQMLNKEVVLNKDNNKIWMNDCDAFTNASNSILWIQKVFPYLPVQLRNRVKKIFSDTATSIQANAKFPNGTYGANWEGPALGTWAAGTNNSIASNAAISAESVLMIMAGYYANNH